MKRRELPGGPMAGGAGKIPIQAGGAEHQIISRAGAREEVSRERRNFLLVRDRRPDIYSNITAQVEDLLD